MVRKSESKEIITRPLQKCERPFVILKHLADYLDEKSPHKYVRA